MDSRQDQPVIRKFVLYLDAHRGTAKLCVWAKRESKHASNVWLEDICEKASRERNKISLLHASNAHSACIHKFWGENSFIHTPCTQQACLESNIHNEHKESTYKTKRSSSYYTLCTAYMLWRTQATHSKQVIKCSEERTLSYSQAVCYNVCAHHALPITHFRPLCISMSLRVKPAKRKYVMPWDKHIPLCEQHSWNPKVKEMKAKKLSKLHSHRDGSNLVSRKQAWEMSERESQTRTRVRSRLRDIEYLVVWDVNKLRRGSSVWERHTYWAIMGWIQWP